MKKREFITDAKPRKPFSNFCSIYRSAKKNQKSFRITQALLKNIWNQAKKIRKIPQLILTVPANLKENYIIKCIITKERKV